MPSTEYNTMTDEEYMTGANETLPDMAFRDNQSRQMRINNVIPAERVSTWFSHHVVREPEDLLTHVQRIHFANSQKSEPALYSALLDLFIALGTRGKALREMMLTQNSNLLSDAHQAFLQASIAAGIHSRDNIEDSAMSMLCCGFSGARDLIEVSTSRRTADRDPLRQALESIECSQIDEARIILERSFFGGTSNAVQQQLLLEIYRKTDDRTHFEKLHATFDSETAPASVDWQALADHFATAS
jgi:hypothetical protein